MLEQPADFTVDLDRDRHELANNGYQIFFTIAGGRRFLVLPGGIPIKDRWRHELEETEAE